MVMKPCNAPGCPTLVAVGTGRCQAHQAEAEQRRGSSTARGYGRAHRRRFRPAVLARNPICVICFRRPSTEADHFPLSRAELIDRGLDPNDPQHGRGLCKPCHSAETATHQPGGFHREP
ncbi:hypothetical protein [Brevibacterium luteolum]|nr:hypothetical protein [Brevibacterium luteolum]MBM7530432.1 5-methylcytosine-specific restriction protein A [Brevibacterium luteolum]